MRKKAKPVHQNKKAHSGAVEKMHPQNPTQSVKVQQSSHFSGPIPSPETLQRYGDINPALIDRIFEMTELDLKHSRDIEQKATNANIEFARTTIDQKGRGQTFALLIAAMAFGTSIALAALDAKTAASIVGGATVVSLVAIFVTGRWTEKRKKSSSSAGDEAG